MSVTAIVLTVFGAVMLILVFMSRNDTVEKLPPLPGESVLFEEEGVDVEQFARPQSTLFRKCSIRVTDCRIIISQKVLFGGSHALHHVITYNQTSGTTGEEKARIRSFMVFTVKKGDVTLSQDGTNLVRITIPESFLAQGQHLSWKTGKIEDYKKIFQ